MVSAYPRAGYVTTNETVTEAKMNISPVHRLTVMRTNLVVANTSSINPIAYLAIGDVT